MTCSFNFDEKAAHRLSSVVRKKDNISSQSI